MIHLGVGACRRSHTEEKHDSNQLWIVAKLLISGGECRVGGMALCQARHWARMVGHGGFTGDTRNHSVWNIPSRWTRSIARRRPAAPPSIVEVYEEEWFWESVTCVVKLIANCEALSTVVLLTVTLTRPVDVFPGTTATIWFSL